jgi:phosphatidylglycerol---prolipoprotein diacylglyceryl transferase
VTVLASIPSPTQGVWDLGPLPIRAYALCIIAGIIACAWIGEKRFVARGGAPGDVVDIAVWAVPFGIVGGRLYHVITTPEPYFGAGGHPLRAFAIWEGGLGIWGAIALGAVGAWIGCRRKGIPLPVFADAIAPGLLVAEAVGRLGNYFNNELHGGPTSLPWALKVYQWADGRAVVGPDGQPVVAGYFHPTFLYELLWCLAAAAVVAWADRRFRLGHGRALALCIALYCAGRLWIELLRDDTAEHFFGLRLNVFTAIVVGVGAVVFFVALRGRPREVLDRGPGTPDVLDGSDEPADAQVSAPAGEPAAAPAADDGEPPGRA